MKESDRQILINYRLSRGKESIDEVKLLMEKEKYFAAMNRIYYGLFYVVNCLVLFSANDSKLFNPARKGDVFVISTNFI